MKKSNIILFFLLIFALVAIVAIQVKVKSSIENIEKFEQTIGYFNKLEIQTGWIVELNTDSLSSISLNNDSLLNLIHQSGDKLILKEYKHKSNRRNIVKLNNFNTQEISIQGNSSLEYYTKSSKDSLKLFLKEHSDIMVYNNKKEYKEAENDKKDSKEAEKEIINTIANLHFKSYGKSSLNIYTHVDALDGIMKDTSSLLLRSKVTIKNLEKSEDARIRYW